MKSRKSLHFQCAIFGALIAFVMYVSNRARSRGMGKVLGGGSSINGMGWARGHKNDWDFFASGSGETAWNNESVLKVYRRMEDRQGAPDPTRRGTGGLVFVQSAPDPNPIAPAMSEITIWQQRLVSESEAYREGRFYQRTSSRGPEVPGDTLSG